MSEESSEWAVVVFILLVCMRLYDRQLSLQQSWWVAANWCCCGVCLWLTHDCGTLQPCICAVQSEYLPIVFIHTACTFLYVPVTQLRMLDGHVYQCTLT